MVAGDMFFKLLYYILLMEILKVMVTVAVSADEKFFTNFDVAEL